MRTRHSLCKGQAKLRVKSIDGIDEGADPMDVSSADVGMPPAMSGAGGGGPKQTCLRARARVAGGIRKIIGHRFGVANIVRKWKIRCFRITPFRSEMLIILPEPIPEGKHQNSGSWKTIQQQPTFRSVHGRDHRCTAVFAGIVAQSGRYCLAYIHGVGLSPGQVLPWRCCVWEHGGRSGGRHGWTTIKADEPHAVPSVGVGMAHIRCGRQPARCSREFDEL